jgi:hypothetical protein
MNHARPPQTVAKRTTNFTLLRMLENSCLKLDCKCRLRTNVCAFREGAGLLKKRESLSFVRAMLMPTRAERETRQKQGFSLQPQAQQALNPIGDKCEKGMQQRYDAGLTCVNFEFGR